MKKLNKSLVALVLTLVVFGVSKANALTVDQFSAICSASEQPCSKHPMLQAYVGGSLDMLASLTEQTGFLKPIYCREPKEIFAVDRIIDFMLDNADTDGDRNAMNLVIEYFELNGGC